MTIRTSYRQQCSRWLRAFSSTRCASPVDFILYPQRWSVLASCLSMSSAWMWITWSPLTVLVADLWNVDRGAVNALSGVYMYIYVAARFICGWLLISGVCRGLTILGAAFNLSQAQCFDIQAVTTQLCRNWQRQSHKRLPYPTPPLIAGSWFGATGEGLPRLSGVV
jgi:hypothetical protein